MHGVSVVASIGFFPHTLESGVVDIAKGFIMAQLLKVQCFTVSADGYGTGEGQTLEQPFGHINPGEFFAWAHATATWANRRGADGSRGLDDYFTRDMNTGIGAEIMGRNKFGPLRGPWLDASWEGWWGDEPPFHTPVFVLTHHDRPTLTLSDTTFHFLNATPAEALAQAKDAANGLDVRLGGGVTTVRSFLDEDLVDVMHVVISPLTAGRGERLWHSPEDLADRFTIETIPSPSGVTHVLLWRKPRG